MRSIELLFVVLLMSNCSGTVHDSSIKSIAKSPAPIIIDGKANEEIWESVDWQPIDQLWLGASPDTEDFYGRYKLSWNEQRLFVLAEIVDDILLDTHPDGLDHYWDDDCLEIFIDEDRSQGIHQYNHNAFAYHISLDGKVVDIGTDSLPKYYNEHVVSKRITKRNVSIWEVAIKLYPDSLMDSISHQPSLLQAGKSIGFAIAYCDSDDNGEREHFVGSEPIAGEDKNRAWIDAGVFGHRILK